MTTRRLWLCLAPTIFCLGDCLVTSLGQPHDYWLGSHHLANEGNPVVLWCMMQHPSAFFALTVLWIAAFSLAILKLPRVLAMMVSLCVTFSHAHCAGTWLFWEPNGFYGTLSLCISCAILFVLALELSRADKEPRTE